MGEVGVSPSLCPIPWLPPLLTHSGHGMGTPPRPPLFFSPAFPLLLPPRLLPKIHCRLLPFIGTGASGTVWGERLLLRSLAGGDSGLAAGAVCCFLWLTLHSMDAFARALPGQRCPGDPVSEKVAGLHLVHGHFQVPPPDGAFWGRHPPHDLPAGSGTQEGWEGGGRKGGKVKEWEGRREGKKWWPWRNEGAGAQREGGKWCQPEQQSHVLHAGGTPNAMANPASKPHTLQFLDWFELKIHLSCTAFCMAANSRMVKEWGGGL